MSIVAARHIAGESLKRTLMTTAITSGIEAASAQPAEIRERAVRLEMELIERYGEPQRVRLQRGLDQLQQFWRADDGDAATFEEFVRTNFAGDQATLDTLFNRFEYLTEQLDGHMLEISREFRQQLDLDAGPILPFDEVFAGYDPSAHIGDDFFQNKLAFVVLLNFPLTTLQERLQNGPAWSRHQWAEVRLAQRFSKRIPAEVNLAIGQAGAEAGRYISEYNIWMHHLVQAAQRQEGRPGAGARVERPFPPKSRLLSHWNLRDEIKASYADREKGLAKQRMIQQVMERIITQTIPAIVVDNPAVDWEPFTNEVRPATARDSDVPIPATVSADREPDTRYSMLWKTFAAAKKVDPHSPTAPTHIARRFDEDREIPEERFKAMLVQVLTSPQAAQIARLIESRLGRPLEAFDIWYSGFRPGSEYSEPQLDEIVAKKYPTAQAYQQDIPNLLVKLGFSPERARYVAANVVVDPGRGAGHAMGAAMRSAKAHLRTRVEKTGMNYKGFNVAMHELGHNVEQTLSLNDVDHTLLQGVPNTAFTEAMAFVFQGRDLEMLGLHKSDATSEALRTLNDFWGTFEISGVALVDMAVWHWMYDHPQATPQELKAATLHIAKEIWNSYYAPLFHKRDVILLGVYSHMIEAFLYLPDYPLGHLIAFQIEEQMKKAGSVGPEVERMVTMGRVTPDLWMQRATGRPVGAEALLEATARALSRVG